MRAVLDAPQQGSSMAVADRQLAIDQVSAWDVPEEDFAQVVNDQARLMLLMELELSSSFANDRPFSSLRF